MSEENQKRIIQILILAISISLSFILAKSIASEFILQVISFLLAIYISTQFLSKKIDFLKQNKLIIDFFIITILIYTLIFSTGDLFSPVFFLIYFLLFGVSLLLEPYSALFLALISSVFFLFTTGKEFWQEIIQLSSIFLISPLALIFGSQYLKLQEKETKIEMLEKEEKILTQEVVSQEKEVRQWTLGELRSRLIKIWENLEKLSADSGMSKTSRQKLVEISNQLSNLLKSAKTLEKKVSK
jgi:hypothetical protein